MTKVLDSVEHVAFYPIKGCREATVEGIRPTSLEVGTTGFEVNSVRDRDWVIFDPNSQTFVSQRGWSGQGKKVAYPNDRLLATVALDVQRDHAVVTSTAGTLELPNNAHEGRRRAIDIFGKILPVVEQSPDASKYFSSLLGREVMLLRSDRDQPRTLPERYQRDGAFNQVSATDGMPFLLASNTSLAQAHKNTGTPAGTIPINRYRANIVLDGAGLGAFGEDYIDPSQPFTVGPIGMWAVKACSRCPVPDIDQFTGERAGGALRVLRGRAGEIFTGETGVFFGQNLVHANLGAISIGDQVAVGALAPTPNVTFRES